MIARSDFIGVPGFWIFGILDGHGANGHLVSDFAKKMIPHYIANIITGNSSKKQSKNDVSFAVAATSQKKKRKVNHNNYLPPLTTSS